MNTGKYIFAQLIEFLPQRIFDRIVMKYEGNKYVKHFTCWNQLLVMMFGQLSNRDSLRDLTSIISAHSNKAYHLGFGKFWWAKFRRTKAGIKMHTLYEIQTDIPTFIHITEAKVHDQRAMDEIPYEQGAYYVFDRGYFDLKRLYHINEIEAYFVIRQRGNLQYEVINEGDTMHNADGVLSDQVIRLTNYFTKQKYPAVLRRVTYYAADKNKTFVYLTNNMEIPATQVALLYKYRWRVELFFKWIKQHLKIKSFWGTTETAVRIQIYSAITAYCMVAIVEHDLKLHRSTYEVLRILSASLLDKTPIKELFTKEPEYVADDGQLTLNFI